MLVHQGWVGSSGLCWFTRVRLVHQVWVGSSGLGSSAFPFENATFAFKLSIFPALLTHFHHKYLQLNKKYAYFKANNIKINHLFYITRLTKVDVDWFVLRSFFHSHRNI